VEVRTADAEVFARMKLAARGQCRGVAGDDEIILDLDLTADPDDAQVAEDDVGVPGAVADGQGASLDTEEEVAAVGPVEDERSLRHERPPS
jgi:hypothetical protein